MPALSIRDLRVSFGSTEILRGVTLSVDAGETLGIVGESGCGKSMTGLAAMRLLPPGGKIIGGEVVLGETDLTKLSESRMRKLRGSDIAMIFQDPFTSLNPMMRVGEQIAEAIVLHQELGWDAARKKSIEMLKSVGVPSPESAARKYPHQLSGGQRQRVMIGIAFSCHPKVLIADEPTTALDVTLQAQILVLLKELQQREGTAVLLISHDIGVIGSVSDRICVFYAGRVAEVGPRDRVLQKPKHPYTQGLLAALPGEAERLASIPGQPPDFSRLGKHCSFSSRCPYQFDKCGTEPGLRPLGGDHRAACWLDELPERLPEPVTEAAT